MNRDDGMVQISDEFQSTSANSSHYKFHFLKLLLR
jgi:hypothetical protein